MSDKISCFSKTSSSTTNGKLIVIEGLDGSGKATQTKILSKWLDNNQYPHQKISFPDYDSASSALIKMYLGGEFGDAPGDVNAFAASTFYAVDRYSSWKTGWGKKYRCGGLILADRYATSNQIHQCAKLPQNEWEDYICWMEDLEYTRMGIPKPDLVLFIAVEPAVSQTLLAQRYAEAGCKDIHEKDLAYLNQCQKAALWCTKSLAWKCITGSENGIMRTREAIANDMINHIKEIL